MNPSITLAFIISIICFIIFYLFNQQFVKLFITDTEIINIASSILKYMAPMYFTYTIIETLLAFFKGVNKAIIPTICNIICVVCIRMGWLIFVVSKYSSWQMIQLCYPLSWLATSICYIIYYLFLRKRLFY